ncbi:MAG: hypothetical protein COA41_15300 [Sphingopyxis sp.]|nr:MAG: hypothetical protein COA41_15300 [Sphingopyxis sp.]
MTKTMITTATLALALSLTATGAQAQSRNDLSAGNNQSEVGLLLPAVQSAREAARRSSPPPSASDILEAELRKFFRFTTPME